MSIASTKKTLPSDRLKDCPRISTAEVSASGFAEALRSALEGHHFDIRTAFVYGSIAKGEDTASSDIDMVVVSEG